MGGQKGGREIVTRSKKYCARAFGGVRDGGCTDVDFLPCQRSYCCCFFMVEEIGWGGAKMKGVQGRLHRGISAA